MKRELERTTDGRAIVVLTAETDEDRAEIARMEAAGEIDAFAGFAEYDEAAEQEKRAKQKRAPKPEGGGGK